MSTPSRILPISAVNLLYSSLFGKGNNLVGAVHDFPYPNNIWYNSDISLNKIDLGPEIPPQKIVTRKLTIIILFGLEKQRKEVGNQKSGDIKKV